MKYSRSFSRSSAIHSTLLRTCFLFFAVFSMTGCPIEFDSADLRDSCYDGIQNQNETGVDCGGRCPEECEGEGEFGPYTSPSCTITDNTVALDSTPVITITQLDSTDATVGRFAIEGTGTEGTIIMEFGVPGPPLSSANHEVVDGEGGQLEASEVFIEIYYPNLPGTPTYISDEGTAHIEVTNTEVRITICDSEFFVDSPGPPPRTGNLNIVWPK